MFSLLDGHSIHICLDQFYSFSNLILLLKFHKIILAFLLGSSSTRPKQSSLYFSNLNFYCSGFDVSFVHASVVCYRFSICILLTSLACDDVCLCVDVLYIYIYSFHHFRAF
jgi:hypothetical protein